MSARQKWRELSETSRQSGRTFSTLQRKPQETSVGRSEGLQTCVCHESAMNCQWSGVKITLVAIALMWLTLEAGQGLTPKLVTCQVNDT